MENSAGASKGKKILDLGCGARKLEGMIGVDIAPAEGVDVIADARKLPFKDSSVDGFNASNLIEHFEGKDVIPFMEELWRVGKNGALVKLRAPHGLHQKAAWGHFDHKQAWFWNSFRIFTDTAFVSDAATKTKVRFKLLSQRLYWMNPDTENPPIFSKLLNRVVNAFANRFPEQYERIFGYWVGGCEEIWYELQVVKKS